MKQIAAMWDFGGTWQMPEMFISMCIWAGILTILSIIWLLRNRDYNGGNIINMNHKLGININARLSALPGTVDCVIKLKSKSLLVKNL